MPRPSLLQIERKWTIYKEAAASVSLARFRFAPDERLGEKIKAADKAYAEYLFLVEQTKAVMPHRKKH
jgi:hypothetical protein